MDLFLASEAKNDRSMKEIERFVGGFYGQKCLYIPTASNGDFFPGKNYGLWKKGDTYTEFASLNLELDVLNLEEVSGVDLTDRFLDADIIFMQGGSSSYLLYWIYRCSVDIVLKKALNQGVKYIGSSAGSMIMGKTSAVEEWFPGEAVRGAHFLPALGLVDFDVFPHYEEQYDELLAQNYTGELMYLLKNGEAIEIHGSELSIVGEERIVGAKNSASK